jgi:gluconate kinase
MTAAMLDSQLATLEEPGNAIQVDGDLPPEEIAVEIQKRLGLT